MSTSQTAHGLERIMVSFETPKSDDSEYSLIRLPNELEVLLVHNSDIDKASAAMCVAVGNFNDGDTLGTAHATEHLLFLGSEKYPEANGFPEYVSKHSGKYNAYTYATTTVFHFELTAKPAADGEFSPLYDGLDRFANLLFSPLFRLSDIDGELDVVSSEHNTNMADDSKRMRQLRGLLSNPVHPWSQFETGTYKTLMTDLKARGVNVRDHFVEFHDIHYTANRMKLVVLGREPLHVLEKWVADKFVDTNPKPKNKNLPLDRWETNVVLRPEDLLTVCFADPVADSRWVDVEFPFLDETSIFGTRPSSYLRYLIKYQGPGGLFSSLNNDRLVTDLFPTVDPVCPGTEGIFQCRIHCTEKGIDQWEQIVIRLLNYLSLLRKQPLLEDVFSQLKVLGDNDFHFPKKASARKSASKFTTHISKRMQTSVPREWLLSKENRTREFDEALVQRAWECLRPDNFKLTVVSWKFKSLCDQQEKWYGTKYTHEKLAPEFLAKINRAWQSQPRPEFRLPFRNDFISKLELKDGDSTIGPKVIKNNTTVRTWYKGNFREPLAHVFVLLRTAVVHATVVNAAKTMLYLEVVEDKLKKSLFDAEHARMKYSLISHSTGITIRASSSDKVVLNLLENLVRALQHLEIKEDRFEEIKDELLRKLRNSELRIPWHQAYYLAKWLVGENDYTSGQIAAEVPCLTVTDIRQFYSCFLERVHIEIFTHGSLYEEEALKCSSVIKGKLQPRALAPAEWPTTRLVLFPPGSNYLYPRTLNSPAIVNNCIEYHLHIGLESDHVTRAKLLLLHEMIHEPFWDKFRTQDHTGYAVFCEARMNTTTMSLRMAIEGREVPEHLEMEIESFLTAYVDTLKAISSNVESMAKFEAQKQSLRRRCLERPQDSLKEAERYWKQIRKGSFDFERGACDASQVEALTIGDMIEFFGLVIPSSPTRSKLAIHLTAQKKTKPVVFKDVGDVMDFKSKMPLAVDPKPVKDIHEFC